jgi:hypothetical protein
VGPAERDGGARRGRRPDAPARRLRTAARLATAAAAVVLVALIAIPAAVAAFSGRTQNENDIVTAAPDFVAPVITATAVGKTQGGATGFVAKGGGYYAYANVAADTGSPASGIATVKANLSAITVGETAATLVAGSYSAGGVSYDYRSAELLSDALEGTQAFQVTATDVAGNARTLAGSMVADTVAPTAADIQTTNVGGGTNGLAEQGDTIVYTFSEPIEPQTILAGWNGSATSVVVRVNDNGILGLPAGNDSFQILNAANTTVLPLGAVDLGRNDYAAGLLGGSYRFGASGTASTMTMSGNTITIVLGTYNSTIIVDAVRGTAAGTGKMTWTPVATPYDRAANPMSITPAVETGAADKDF